MVSFLHRYVAGEQEAVWNELRNLGHVPDHLAADVEAVAVETMRRVVRHVQRLAEALTSFGFVPAYPDTPLHRPATAAELADLPQLEGQIGGLPAALRACMSEVGTVWFIGDCPSIALTYHGEPRRTVPPPIYPDPLCLPGAAFLRAEWDEYRDDPEWRAEPSAFAFAPDELHKANISGSTHDLALPQTLADPVLEGVAGREGITLVEYLRVSVAWGGFPGWAFAAGHMPADLAALRVTPDF